MVKYAKIKFILGTLFIAILISVLIFIIYNSQNVEKAAIDAFDNQEHAIAKRIGVSNEKFRFCAYPETNSYSKITWDKDRVDSENKYLKLIFKGNKNNINSYLGIHLYLTILLRSYLEKGIIEFWIKGGRNYSLINKLDVCLKEGASLQRMVKFSFPIKISENWQKVSLPISSFQPVKEEYNVNQKFTWEIQEFLFSINDFASDESAELFINDLRISNDNEIICNLL